MEPPPSLRRLSRRNVVKIAHEVTSGLSDLKDLDALDGVLAAAYGLLRSEDGGLEQSVSDPYRQAAILARGICLGQLFTTGSEGIAVVVGRTHLAVNGYEAYTPSLADDIAFGEAIGDYELLETDIAEWYRRGAY